MRTDTPTPRETSRVARFVNWLFDALYALFLVPRPLTVIAWSVVAILLLWATWCAAVRL